MKRQATKASGHMAETVAANLLRLESRTILDRRVRTRAGEADIVMRKPGLVASVEVKSRTDAAGRRYPDRRSADRVRPAAPPSRTCLAGVTRGAAAPICGQHIQGA